MMNPLPLILPFALAMVLTLAPQAWSEQGPAEIVLPAKIGQVTFNHSTHQQRVEECSTCHHQGEPSACDACHGVKIEAPLAKDAFHRQCRSCHQKTSGPTGCKECHK